MNDNDIITRFSRIVTNVLKQPFQILGLQVDLKTNLGADSMDLIDILESIELEFDIGITEEQASLISNVGQAVAMIRGRVDANS